MTRAQKRELADLEHRLGNAKRYRERLRATELWRPEPAKKAEANIAALEAELAELKGAK